MESSSCRNKPILALASAALGWLSSRVFQEGGGCRRWRGSSRLDVGVDYIGGKADSITTWDPWAKAGCGPGSSCHLADLSDPYLTLIALASSPRHQWHTGTQRARGQTRALGPQSSLPHQLGSDNTARALRRTRLKQCHYFLSGGLLRRCSQLCDRPKAELTSKISWWERRDLNIVTV